MKKRVAVMDLGTNSFHLLIVEKDGNQLTELVHEQEPVKLGEGGINKGFIQPEPFERGLKAMQKFNNLILQNQVQQVSAIATSALRSAANGSEFIDKVKTLTGIKIELINGNEEADFIYKGVKAGNCLSDQNSLIVDIGGGSVEFIICNGKGIKWKQSFEIGAARLMDKFHQVDPISAESISELNQYLEKQLKDLFTETSKHVIENMIGSSGVFETYAGLITLDKGKPIDFKITKHYAFIKNDLLTLIDKLIQSTHQQRMDTNGIIPIRVDMIVTSSLLTRFIMEKLGIDQVAMSTHSLKEGVLAEMMD